MSALLTLARASPWVVRLAPWVRARDVRAFLPLSVPNETEDTWPFVSVAAQYTILLLMLLVQGSRTAFLGLSFEIEEEEFMFAISAASAVLWKTPVLKSSLLSAILTLSGPFGNMYLYNTSLGPQEGSPYELAHPGSREALIAVTVSDS